MISNSIEIIWDSVTYSILSLAEKKFKKKHFLGQKWLFLAIFGLKTLQEHAL